MEKPIFLIRNVTLIAGTLFAALAAFSLATNFSWHLHALTVLLFWFVAVPGLAYYVAFKLNLEKDRASAQAIAGLIVFYALMLGITYRLTETDYFQIMALSFLPTMLAVYSIQLIVRQVLRKQEKPEAESEAAG
ncbi:hypothetical protein BH24BAC1_BH24BAC1_10870 [soil metagenome]|jgi:peptidoglycan/LPS O-acetylase OafA/YrhL